MVADVELDILLRGAYLKTIYAKSVSSQITNRLPNTPLLIVVDSEAYDEEKYTRLLNRLTEEPDGRKGKDLVRVITELELTNLDTAAFRNRLAIHA